MMDDRSERRLWPAFRSFQGAGRDYLWRDLFAGLTLAAIAIPEQMATARLGGFEPQTGFVAFIVASAAFATFGGSRFLSVGADSTITPIFAGSLAAIGAIGAPDYFGRAAVLAILVGVTLGLANLLRAGWIADLLSLPVTTGFLAGVALHIAISQTPILLGLPAGEGPLLERVAAIAANIGKTNASALSLGAATLLFVAGAEKLNPRIPGALIALVATTVVVDELRLEQHGVAVLGSVSSRLPRLSLPEASLGELPGLIGLAIVVALVAMVQTSATSRSFVAPGESADIDRDFLGVAAGNICAGLLGAFPVDASPPRTAIVVESGGRSQLAGLYAAAVVTGVALFAADALAHVPAAALAGVLMFIAARIFRVSVMAEVFSRTKSEFALIVITILAVALLPVEMGVALSIMLSLIHGLWTVNRARIIEFERLPGSSVWWPASSEIKGEKLDGVLVIAFQAPLSFINAYGFQQDLRAAVAERQADLKLVVLEASSIVEVDFTAARILRQSIADCREAGVDFAVARLESLRAQEALRRFSVIGTLGEGRVFRSVDDATRALAPTARAS